MPAEPTVLLLHGEETFLVDEEARRVLARWRKDLVSDFGYEALDPGGLNVGRLRDSLQQSPFLDPYRVIALRQVAPSRADSLAAAFTGVADTTRAVVTVNGRLGAASKLAKAISALPTGQVRELPRLKGRKVSEWAAQRARELGLAPNIGAAVVQASPADLGVIDSELRKLAAFQDGGGRLDPATLRDLLAGGREEDVFRLTDQLFPRPSAGAFRAARSLLEAGASPTTIAWRIARQLSLVLEVKARQERGEGLAVIQAGMREHPFVIQKAFDSAHALSEQTLESGLRAVLAYEWEVKSGQIEADSGLEGLLARL